MKEGETRTHTLFGTALLIYYGNDFNSEDVLGVLGPVNEAN